MFSFRTTFTVFAAIACLNVSIFAQHDFKVGDEVRFDRLGGGSGKIVEIKNENWIEVEYERRGRTRSIPFRAKDLTKVGTTNTPAKPRTWTDSTGKHKILATLHSQTNTSVKLKKQDGRVVTLPLSKLSKADRDFLKKQNADAEQDSDSPFAGGSFEDSATNRSSRLGRNRSNRKSRTDRPAGDMSNAESVILSSSAWQFQPDSAKVASTGTPRRVEFRSDADHVTAHRMEVCMSSNESFVAVSEDRPFKDIAIVHVFSTADGSSILSNLKIPENGKVLAVSNSGQFIATTDRPFASRKTHVEVWKIENGEAVSASTWTLPSDISSHDIEAARFVDENTLAVHSGRYLSTWEWKSRRAQFMAEVGFASQVGFSPNHRIAMIPTDQAINLVDLQTGEAVGELALKNARVSGAVMSPDGKKLVALADGMILYVWDLSNGKELTNFWINVGGRPQSAWASPGQILFGSHIYDIKNKVAVWNVNSISVAKTIAGNSGRVWYLADDRKQVAVVPAKLYKKAFKTKADDYAAKRKTIIEPTSVSLDIDLPFDHADEEKIRERLEKLFKKLGYTVDSAGEIDVRLAVKELKSRDVTIREFGGFRRDQTAVKCEANPTQSEIGFYKNGKKIWSRKRTNDIHGVLHLQKDESVQDAVDRVCEANPAFFLSVRIPRELYELPKSLVGNTDLKFSGAVNR